MILGTMSLPIGLHPVPPYPTHYLGNVEGQKGKRSRDGELANRDKVMGRQGDGVMERQGDRETGRQGDRETGRWGERV
jgi:hypothetical protein